MEGVPCLSERYKAAMVLSGVGDAVGYRSGSWEFNFRGVDIYEELQSLGGLTKLDINKKDWPVSDDTVLHLATGEALSTGIEVGEKLFLEIAWHYVRGMRDMSGRAPGGTTSASTNILSRKTPPTYIVPFNKRGGGCGAAMRAMCIGLRYPEPDQLMDLITVAVESGRMTHNVPVGYLGSVACALFTAYAVQRKPVHEWGAGLMSNIPKVLDYVIQVGRDVQQNKDNWSYFVDKWNNYLELRGISDGKGLPTFPEEFGFIERDAFYKSVSHSGWGGSSGHDAPMIAYDALLGAGESWEELCLRGMIHGGDSDSTGVMAACWWGALYGMDKVPNNLYKKLEYRERLEKVAKNLYELSHGNEQK
ncbi:protein ADP-ribosylarginine hydrolase-like [Anneissia japonica]|uniref:protein ADP-ribosylarginine hydrolase-like n=1 Tax=Anneissia japonica TaxID=1529436 RepID=UPI001425AFF0|nr:protein ADP-ribosylarginine hydrolase-like [Anneissia japonica]